MNHSTQTNPSRDASPRLFALLTTAALMVGTVSAQRDFRAEPYGHPSFWGAQDSAAVLSLSLSEMGEGRTALRLEGGRPGYPVHLLFSDADARTEAGGALLLVRPSAQTTTGRFDSAGVFLFPLDEAQFGADAHLYVQGMAPNLFPAGAAFSSGLHVQRRDEECGEAPMAPQPPSNILVEEFGDLMAAGHLESAIGLALNSKGDALELELKGSVQVPVYVGITAGGKAAFKAAVTRGADQEGAVIYDLAIGADVAAAAGVGVGVAGVGLSGGAGTDVVWRYHSAHEVARAIRSMVILQAVGPRIELASLALHNRLADIDRAIHSVRRGIDRVRRTLRSWMPWRNNPIVRRLQRVHDRLIAQRRAAGDRARSVVNEVIRFIAEERIFITSHLNGYEIRSTVAGDISVGGKASDVELKASAESERKFSLRAEFVAESDAVAFEQKATFTTKVQASASLVLGGEVSAKRVIEVSQKIQGGRGGLHLEESGTTVKITLDRAYALSLGMVVSGKAAVGGEVSAQLRLEDLLGYSVEAIEILTGSDNLKFAELLLAFPIQFEATGRYEAGLEFDLGFEAKGVGDIGIGASAKLIDKTESLTYEGGSTGDEFMALLREATEGGVSATMRERLEAVRGEVAATMRR